MDDRYSLPSHRSTLMFPNERLAGMIEIRLSVTNAWVKLDEYYERLNDSPLFAAAVILHPGRSLRWLEARWVDPKGLGWLRDAKAGLEAYWGAWYAGDELRPGSAREERPQQDQRRQQGQSGQQEQAEYDQWLGSNLQRLRTGTDDQTELERYLRLDLPIAVENPIQWWIDNKQLFPTLSSLALDLFSIPAMAADCERAFSLAKLTLTTQRLAMDPVTLEQIQCLKNWVRRNAVSLGGLFFTIISGLDG